MQTLFCCTHIISSNPIKRSNSPPRLVGPLLSSLPTGSSEIAASYSNSPSSSFWDCRLGPSALWGGSGWPVLPSYKESESHRLPIKGLFPLVPALNLGINLSKGTSFDPTQELSVPLRTRPGPQSLPSDWALRPRSGLT